MTPTTLSAEENTEEKAKQHQIREEEYRHLFG
jgi:hypothetical protein